MNGLLLDTCAVLWIGQGQGLTAGGKQRLASALQDGEPLFVSTISAWEIGMLVAKGRVSLTSDPSDWLDLFMQTSGAAWLAPTPTALARSSFLPAGLRGDPVDRILVSSAREAQLALFTGDKVLLDYGSAGHIRVHRC